MSEEVRVGRRYILLDRIGVGGMGEVWRAHDQLTGDAVATKILRPPIAAAPAAELRFQREIQAMARLNHPRVVPIIDAGSDPEVGLFFVMELQIGKPLHEVAASIKHWQYLWPIVDQILETLAHAHSHAVIHRDIKPDNILVDENGEVILLDFGVARLKDRARSGTSAYDLLGTVDYAAPEQATGNRRRIGPWTDLYCLGILLYEIVCGRVPFWASSPVQSLIMRLNSGCPPLDPRPGFQTPVGLWDALNQMLNPEPFERFRTAADARAVLAQLSEGEYEQLTPDVDGANTGPYELGQREQATDDEAAVLLKHRRSLLTSTFESSIGAQPPEAPLRTTTLVGRDKLLLSLSRGVDHWISDPKPGVLVLAGEAGSGKTRLVKELLSPFLAQGDIEGHHHRWRHGPSMRQTMIAIAGGVGLNAEDLREHVEWFLAGHGLEPADEALLVGWLCAPPDSTKVSMDIEQTSRFLRACTDQRPFILTLDGVNRIDEQVMGVIRAVRSKQLPIIVVLTGGEPKPAAGVKIPNWLGTATRTLHPLSDVELTRIVHELADLPEELCRLVVEESDGNPKRLFRTLSDFRRAGEIIPAWPRWLAAPPDWIPLDGDHSQYMDMQSIDMSMDNQD
ncbi:MAG: serine/threonine-protein kinase [Myxococcota bacterium]|nr:serine/threonine-protein kinase [Myxococcota bacterium]